MSRYFGTLHAKATEALVRGTNVISVFWIVAKLSFAIGCEVYPSVITMVITVCMVITSDLRWFNIGT